MVPLTRGTTPRYIQVQDLASSLAIVGPTGPSGEDGLDGAPGASGIGIIFRGVYDSAKTYTYDDLRRDAVKYNGIYYLAKVQYESTTGLFDVDAWEQFQGQFESVATNLLLTEDMAVTRSIVLGTEDSNIGTLRSATASNINSGVGFYFDAEGNALIGNTSDNYIRWNGTTLEISGTIVQGTITDLVLLESLKGDPGLDGTDGANGDPVYLHIAYSNSDNGSVDFSPNNPTGRRYLGQYTSTNPTKSSDPSVYSWVLIKGQDGTNGQSEYLHIAYSTSSDGSANFSTSTFNDAIYIGTYSDFTASDSTNYIDYTWTRIRGNDGVDGVNGQSMYLHIAYATNSNGSSGFSLTYTGVETYIGTYTNTNVTDSTNPNSYSWKLFKGTDGTDGADGTSVVLKGSVATVGNLPTGVDVGDLYVVFS